MSSFWQWTFVNYLVGLHFFTLLLNSDVKWNKKEARFILCYPLWGIISIPILGFIYLFLIVPPKIKSLLKDAL